MSTYRVYMSVRKASTGEQVADITIMANVNSASLAEMYVEDFTSGARSPGDGLDWVCESLRVYLGDPELLFIYMKEVQK